VAFPQTPLDVHTELQIGGAWTDVSAAPYLRDKIAVTGGRQDEGSHVDPASCAMTINNRSGTYSPRNPTSSLYGKIGRNTPLRVSVAAGSCFLAATDETAPDVRVSTPSVAAVQITGDLDVRWDVEPADWDAANVVELGGKWGAAGQRSWHAYLFSGSLWFGWTTDGTTENSVSASLSAAVHPRRMCLRVTVDVDNGAGGRTVTFFTGTSLAGPWTQIGSTTIAGTTATASSTASLDLADVTGDAFLNSACRIYAFELRSGIGGTVVANPTFTALTPGTTSFTDSAGRAWTASSTSAITNLRPRHVGEVSAWPQRWDVDGKDVYVPLQAAGISRRLGQGASPLDSALRRSVVASSPVAYWPLEDGTASTQAASAILGGTPLLPAPNAPNFAAIEGPPGSLQLPDFTAGGSLAVASMPAGSTASWTIECLLLFPTSFTSGSTIPLAWRTTGSTVAWQLSATPGPDGGVAFQWQNTTGSSVHDASGGGNVTDGRWHQVRITVYQTGSNINLQLWLDGEMLFEDTDVNVTCGAIQSVTINPNRVANANLPSVGHVAVWSPRTSVATYPAAFGYAGETTDTRITRLSTEEGVPLIAPYGVAGDTPLGPQLSSTLLNLLQEATDADVGILYEPRHMIALAARSRISLYNQPTTLALNYQADGEVPPPLQPTEDDQQTRNDITRGRPNGSSARVTLDSGTLSTAAPPNGVGRYADSQTVNVASDDQLQGIAGWWLHLGTWDEARYPQVTVDLAAAPWLIDQATAVEVGDRITISNLPPWVAPGSVDLLVQGYTETIGEYDWTITFNCTPAGPWTVGVLDDPVLGRLDTDGSQLSAGVSATATSLQVQVTGGPLWVTTANQPSEFPFNVRIGGEVMTVTGITGSSSPQTFTVTRSVNGVSKSQASGTDVRLAQPLILAL
jgi:hypothetical protein